MSTFGIYAKLLLKRNNSDRGKISLGRSIQSGTSPPIDLNREQSVLSTLIADFKIIFDRDPAARNWLEVLFCYPGLQALVFHRFAHRLYRLKIPFIPRFISHIARFLTGVEIHPGAIVGTGVFIDHGMGVVIGETAIVGDYALIYQGVTLGGTGKQSGKRHPTLGENVVLGTGAKILGNIEIGDNVRIGAGSVVLRDVPSDCTVVGIPGRIVHRSGVKVNPLEHGNLPDSEATVIRALVDRIEWLEQKVQELEKAKTSTLELCLVGKNATENISLPQNESTQVVSLSEVSCRLCDREIAEYLASLAEAPRSGKAERRDGTR